MFYITINGIAFNTAKVFVCRVVLSRIFRFTNSSLFFVACCHIGPYEYIHIHCTISDFRQAEQLDASLINLNISIRGKLIERKVRIFEM